MFQAAGESDKKNENIHSQQFPVLQDRKAGALGLAISLILYLRSDQCAPARDIHRRTCPAARLKYHFKAVCAHYRRQFAGYRSALWSCRRAELALRCQEYLYQEILLPNVHNSSAASPPTSVPEQSQCTDMAASVPDRQIRHTCTAVRASLRYGAISGLAWRSPADNPFPPQLTPCVRLNGCHMRKYKRMHSGSC